MARRPFGQAPRGNATGARQGREVPTRRRRRRDGVDARQRRTRHREVDQVPERQHHVQRLGARRLVARARAAVPIPRPS